MDLSSCNQSTLLVAFVKVWRQKTNIYSEQYKDFESFSLRPCYHYVNDYYSLL